MAQDCYENRVRRCTNWNLSFEALCVQPFTQTIKSCTKKVDQGWSTCSEQREVREKKCTGWKKWFCKAWAWFTYLACAVYTWFEFMVCVAWAFFTITGCLLWKYIPSRVCQAWAWTVYFFCIVPQLVDNVGFSLTNWLNAFIQCLNPKDAPRNPVEKPGWKLAFEDDFINGVVDPNKWEDLPWWGKRYAAPSAPHTTPQTYFHPSNILPGGPTTVWLEVNNSPFTANDPAYGGNFSVPYTGAWLEWRPPLDQHEGYFEIRCKIPGSSDMWPAFWLASRQSWPPEIDVFEFYTNDTSRFESTLHWGQDPNHPKATSGHAVCKASQYFHIYACQWEPGKVSWFYDNMLVRTETNGMSSFTYPMMVILNNSPDTRQGHNPQSSIYPNYLVVDYVRAYAR